MSDIFDEITAKKDIFDEIEPSFLSKVGKYAKQAVSPYVGAAEGIASNLSGLIAAPVSGVAGLAKTITSGADAGTKTIEDVSKSLTYQPHTAEGEATNELINKGMEIFIGKPAKTLGDIVYEAKRPIYGDTGAALAGTLAETLATLGIPALIGAGLKGKGKAVEKRPSEIAEVAQKKVKAPDMPKTDIFDTVGQEKAVQTEIPTQAKTPVTFQGIQENPTTKNAGRPLILVNEPSGSTVKFNPELHEVTNLKEFNKAIGKEPTVTSGNLPSTSQEGGFVKLPQGAMDEVHKLWTSTKEFVQPMSSLSPETRNWYLGERYRTLGREAQVERIAKTVFDKTKKLSPELKQQLFDSLENPDAIAGLPTGYQSYAKMLRNVNKAAGDMLIKRGMLDEATVQAMQEKGGYVKYLYLKNILGDKMPSSPGAKLDLGELKQRKDLTREQQRAIGLVEDVSVAEPVGLTQSLGDSVKYDFFDKLASNKDITWEPSVVEVEGQKWGIGKLADEVKIQEKMAEQAPNVPEIQQRLATLKGALDEASANMGQMPEGYLAIPNSQKYGNLAGTFIKKPIARDILPIIDITISDPKRIGRVWNNLVKLEEKSMAGFKVGKTALNVPTAARNVVSNMIQLNMSGIPVWDIPIYTEKALVSMLKRSPEYITAERNGLFKTNWGMSEINEVLNTVRGMQKSPLGIWEKIGDIAKYYGKIDDVFKMAKFTEQLEKGVDTKTAVIEAQKWGMDYSLAAPSVKLARRHIIPFASYSYKIAPLIAESLAKRPWVIGKYAAIPYAMAEVAKKTLNLTDQDWEKLKKDLPLFIKKNNTYAILPFKSPEGNAQWVNLEYFFPWQNMTSLGRDVRQGNFGELLGDIGVGNPLMDLYSVAKGTKGDNPPKDPFTGKDVYNRLDSPTEKAVKTGEWLFSKWGPSMLTRQGAAGYTERAIKGEPDKYGRTVTPAQAAGRWMGFNIVAPTPQQVAKEKSALSFQLRSSLNQILKDPTVKTETKQGAVKKYREELLKLQSGGIQ